MVVPFSTFLLKEPKKIISAFIPGFSQQVRTFAHFVFCLKYIIGQFCVAGIPHFPGPFLKTFAMAFIVFDPMLKKMRQL
jgi:hypothetical protein